MACTCDRCWRKYKVDFNIPDKLWAKIKPSWKPEGAGLYCPSCIGHMIESRNEYRAFEIKEAGDE